MRGLFIGRFQPFHLGHLSIIRSSLDQVDELIIGIGSAELSHTLRDPFTAGERMEMVLLAAEEMGFRERIVVIPVRDINRYSVWAVHVASLCPEFEVVFSNNPLTRILFGEAGYRVEATPFVDRSKLSGHMIRDAIIGGKTWEDRVPEVVAAYIKRIGGPERLCSLADGDHL